MARPNPLSVLRAKKAFKDFTGTNPTKSHSVALDNHDIAGYRLGEMVGVAYEATRDGKKDQYFHRFKKKARPNLVVRSDGKQLYVTDGDYHVTDRGIEDMPELFIVNPSSRRRGATKKKPAAKRKTAVAKTVRRRRRRATFRRNPSPVRAMRRNPVRRRRRRSRAVSVTSYRRNPVRRRRSGRVSTRGMRRNPIRVGRGKGSFAIMPMIVPAILIGAGAVGSELLMGYLPIPAGMKTGPLKYLTKAVVSIAGGWAIAKFINRSAGEAFALGGIAIASHDAIKEQVVKFMPSAQFGQYMGEAANWNKYGYASPSLRSYPKGGLGYYTPGQSYSMAPQMGQYMGVEEFAP